MTQTQTPPAAPAAPDQDLLAAMDRMRANDFAAAADLAEAALIRAANRGPLLAIASLAALRLRAPERAVPHLRELVALNPADLASRTNLARALIETGAPSEALTLVAGSPHPGLARIEGVLRQQAGDPVAAVAAYARVIEAEPSDVTSWNNLGNIHAEAGAFDNAIHCFEQAISLAPDDVGIYLNLADVLRRADRGGPRLKVMRDAAKLAPDDRRVLTELAMALAHVEELDDAIAVLQSVNSRWDSFGESHIELGRLYEALNRIDDMARLVASIDPRTAPPEAAFLFAWQAQRESRFDDAAALAASIPETIHPMRRQHLIGSIADRQDRSAEAFAAFAAMNEAALADSIPRTGPSFRETVERDTAYWSASLPTAANPIRSADGLRDPVFLVGFPRSGTTLLDTMLMGLDGLSVLEERPMLASVVAGLDGQEPADLDAARIAELRQRYFAAARVEGWDERRWLVDKHPLNMVRVPLISLLFPDARIILAERHPYDVVLSCFMANFTLNFAMRSFTTLEEAALTYDAAFRAWEQGIALFAPDWKPVRYERLVDNARGELAPLVEWLGLEWDDRLLAHQDTARERGRVKTASYSQIREGLYTRARYRWLRYADQLAPVVPLLESWAGKMGYPTDPAG